MLSEGEEGRIVSIVGGYGLRRRLAELGFNQDTKVKVLRASSGPMLVLLRDCRIAIGRGVAMKIFVEVER
jgi:ferrous iron transport protein A